MGKGTKVWKAIFMCLVMVVTVLPITSINSKANAIWEICVKTDSSITGNVTIEHFGGRFAILVDGKEVGGRRI